VELRNSYKSWRRKFQLKFPDTTCRFADTVSKLVKKVRTHSILIDRRPLKINRVLAEEKLDDVGRHIDNSPRKSFWRLAQPSGVSVGSAWTATERLHIRPYKIAVVFEIRLEYRHRTLRVVRGDEKGTQCPGI
jgi:hypothetical protein